MMYVHLSNASEFSCGFSFPYSTKLLRRAGGYNSSLGGGHGEPKWQLLQRLDLAFTGSDEASENIG